MTRVFVGLLMIFLISGQTTAQEFEITYDLIKTIIEWGMNLYAKVDAHRNPDRSRQNILEIMKQVEEVQTKLDNLDTHLDIKLDSMLSTLLADIRLEGSLNTLKEKLRHGFSKIDRYFDLSREYKFLGIYGNHTLKDFAHKALWSTDSVPDLLNNLHEAFLPGGVTSTGFLSVMNQRTVLNILHDCDTFVSAQQKVYYIYIQLLLAEIKGLITQQHCYMLQRVFDENSYSYAAELNITRTNFQTRLSQYYTLFTSMIPHFSSHLRRCEAKKPERGINILELEKFSRIAVLDSKFVGRHGCLACPGQSDLAEASENTKTTIYNCREMGTAATSCPGDPKSRHEYLWWKDAKGNHYGPNTPCEKTKPIYGGFMTVPPTEGPAISILCDVCVCSVDMNKLVKEDDTTIWRMSVHEQHSDIMNNYVVTGVKFVTHENALHLQIQESQFLISGMVSQNTRWKDLHQNYLLGGGSDVPISYESLRNDRKTLYLDDIKVSDGYVVTGVRLKLIDDHAFQLQIYQTEFDLETGKLFMYGGGWIDASTHPMYPEHYKEARTEIIMESSDDPTRASEFQYTLESNKMIKFTHTDIYKDAGQTTIPLLDAQPVEAQPSFPLGGIGIGFRGRVRYGGYLAPRIYTLDITSYMKFPKYEPEAPTTTEKIEYEYQSYDRDSNSPNSRYEYSTS